jgi:hypothetical protein
MPPKSMVVAVLEYAERHGVNFGGLLLLACGLYGGQYASLFPLTLQTLAGSFCLAVSASGFLCVVYSIVRSFMIAPAHAPIEKVKKSRKVASESDDRPS